MRPRYSDSATLPASHRSILVTACRTAGILSTLALGACVGPQDEPPPGAEPLPCAAPVHRTLRIDRLDVPLDASAADELGADLDGDGTIDNQAGNVLAAVSQAYTDLRASMPARVNARLGGDVVWLIDVAQCDGGEARVTFARGEARADGAFHLVDDGTVPAAATVIDGHVSAWDGIGAAPLGAIADLADAGLTGWTQTYPAAVRLDLGEGEASGAILGGLSPGYAGVVADSFLPYIQARLDAGNTDWGHDVDHDGDGVVTRAELELDSLFHTIMRPDLDADGPAIAPPAVGLPDGTPESLSFGFGLHAVDVAVE